jgi:hypothetical protein
VVGRNGPFRCMCRRGGYPCKKRPHMHTPYELGFYKIPNFEILAMLFCMFGTISLVFGSFIEAVAGHYEDFLTIFCRQEVLLLS